MESNYKKIGSLQKGFGTEGLIKFKVFPEFKEEINNQSFLWIEHDDYHVPYRIISVDNNKRLLKFDDITTPDQASKIHNKSLFILSSDINVEEEGSGVDLFIGYDLFNEDDFIAKIEEIRTIAGFLYGVITYNQKEVLFPFHEDLILEIDPDNLLVRMQLPDGILDL